jgi:hypothetical protein
MGNIIFRVDDDRKRCYQAFVLGLGKSLSDWLKALADRSCGYDSGGSPDIKKRVKEKSAPSNLSSYTPGVVDGGIIKTVSDAKKAVASLPQRRLKSDDKSYAKEVTKFHKFNCDCEYCALIKK